MSRVTTTVTEWRCGRCEQPYRFEPASRSLCKCTTGPVTALRPHTTTISAPAGPPRPRLRAAGPLDEDRANFPRGSHVTVTFTGTVVGSSIANGEHLTFFVETADGRRHAVDLTQGFAIHHAEEQQ